MRRFVRIVNAFSVSLSLFLSVPSRLSRSSNLSAGIGERLRRFQTELTALKLNHYSCECGVLMRSERDSGKAASDIPLCGGRSMSGISGEILKRREILSILRRGMSSVAEIRHRIPQLTSCPSRLTLGSSEPLMTSGRSHLFWPANLVALSAAKTLPSKRKTSHAGT